MLSFSCIDEVGYAGAPSPSYETLTQQLSLAPQSTSTLLHVFESKLPLPRKFRHHGSARNCARGMDDGVDAGNGEVKRSAISLEAKGEIDAGLIWPYLRP